MTQLNAFGRGFNLRPNASNNIGYRHSDETKKHLSRTNRGRSHTDAERALMLGRVASKETRQRLSDSHHGKSHSTETRRKMSLSHLGVKKGPITEEHRTKLKAAWVRRKQKEANGYIQN